MKKVLIFVIVISLAVMFSGCFNVERNNPYDPDADLPTEEKAVTIVGTVYRGWSDFELSGVEITIGGQTTTSDSEGRYELALLPGNYTLKAKKDGFITEEYQINVSASKHSTQREDISMFIFFEYWDYTTYQPPGPPWNNDPNPSGVGCSATALVLDVGGGYHAMNMTIFDDVDGSSFIDVWANGYGQINPNPANVAVFTCGFEFHSGFANSDFLCGIVDIQNANPFFAIRYDGAHLYYYTETTGPIDTEFIPVLNTIYILEVLVSQDRQNGAIIFYDVNYNPIKTILVHFSDRNIETVDFIGFGLYGNGSTTAQSSISIHFIEVY
ncbi:carboxypeptidase regulatory-like domain-containing protein [Candidatus Dependentiae bacterium]|nr:carboxypeptidase regulatory-like domain-containing protein [Candidatus Dependentiae bacterium]